LENTDLFAGLDVEINALFLLLLKLIEQVSSLANHSNFKLFQIALFKNNKKHFVEERPSQVVVNTLVFFLGEDFLEETADSSVERFSGPVAKGSCYELV